MRWFKILHSDYDFARVGDVAYLRHDQGHCYDLWCNSWASRGANEKAPWLFYPKEVQEVPEPTPPKPAVVARRGNNVVALFDSTNAAVKHAEGLSKAVPSTEYVVYQEKASFKVEPKPSKAELLEESLLQERLRDITSQMHDCNDSHICDVKVVSLSRDENLVTVTYKVQP